MTPGDSGDGLRGLASSLRDGAIGASARGRSLLESARSAAKPAGADDDDAGPPRLPPPETRHPLPVVEEPRILLSSRRDPSRVLTSDRRGRVGVADRRGEREQFLLIPAVGDEEGDGVGDGGDGSAGGGGGASFYLRSYSSGRYLSAGDGGAVTTVDPAGDDVDEKRDGGDADDSERAPEDRPGGGGDRLSEARSELSRRWDSLSSSLAGSVGSTSGTRRVGEAGPGPPERWRLLPRPGGGHAVESAARSGRLACVPSDDAASRFSATVCLASSGGESGGECAWSVRFVSGELCFLSSPGDGADSDGKEAAGTPDGGNGTRRRVRCDLLGRLTLTPDRRGWEVFRLVEAGGGTVRIVSWMHPFCVACDRGGDVKSLGVDAVLGGASDPGVCAEWTVERVPPGGGTCDGVVIRSAGPARRVLRRDGGGGLSTAAEPGPSDGVWRIDAAHSQTYTLTTAGDSAGDGGSIGPFPYVTSNLGQSDPIVLQRVDHDGSVRLYHKAKGRYLRATSDGDVTLDPAPSDEDGVKFASDGGEEGGKGEFPGGDAELWTMDRHPSGGHTFRSRLGGGYLSQTGDGAAGDTSRLVTAPSADRGIWRVGPVLPRAVSSSKIKTFAIGTGVAVGTTVAMPFLMAGMLALVPAEATLAASVLAAGLTGAEAAASAGAIGVTAAIVFREDGGAVGMEGGKGAGGGGEEDEGGRGDHARRPFCGWRSW